METPCTSCVHYAETQVAQFAYYVKCRKDAPAGAFLSKWGCWLYEKRKHGGRQTDRAGHPGKSF